MPDYGSDPHKLPPPFVPGREPAPTPTPRSGGAASPFVPGVPASAAASSPPARITPADQIRSVWPEGGQSSGDLPPITQFLYDAAQPQAAAGSRTPPGAVPPLPGYRPAPAMASPEPWTTGEWTRFDWSAAAALTPDERERAAAAWSDLDWDEDARARGRSRGETVAGTLEEVARRIRSGELQVRGPTGMSEEAAIASVLAALLAQRP